MDKTHVFCLCASVFLALIVQYAFNAVFPSSKSIVSSPQGSYDYIIVGGGTAGSVLANRLSRNSKNKVLLIEAGGFPPYLSTVPLAAPLLQGGAYDWGYLTEPQKFSSGALNNFSSKWPRGKMLGGTGQSNFHINMLNFEDDLDRWSKDFDLPGWNRSIVPRYINRMFCRKSLNRSEPGQPPLGQCSSPPVRVTEATSEMSGVFRQAALEAGIPVATPQDKRGIFTPEADVYLGKRWNIFDGYLKPAMDRANLHVMPYTLVNQILFSGRQVIGIEFEDSSGLTSEVYLRRRGEVLLSAGAVSSPQILMLSGLGPKAHLEDLKIHTVVDLPVGENLQDHLVVPIRVSIQKPMSINVGKIKSLSTLANYFLRNKGYLSTSGVEGMVVMPFSSTDEFGTRKRMSRMSLLFNLGSIDTAAYTEAANIPLQAYKEWFPGADDESAEGFIFLSICLNCKSKGSITLKSTDPKQQPRIDPKYLSNVDDVKCLISAIRLSASFLDTDAFRSIGATMQLPQFPDCGSPSLTSDDYMECLVRKAAITMYHPVGTAHMGKNGVLDQRLRVKEVKGLRVIDASSFPTLPSGTPNSAIIFLAERASDLILEDRRSRKKSRQSS